VTFAQTSDCIVWQADHEEGSLYDWIYPDFQYSGGGIFNTVEEDVEAVASTDVARSGRFSARTTITNAWRSANGKRAVRLMRWTDRPWDDGGEHFENPAYFSTWMYFPEKYNPEKSAPWDPGDGGWWNIFQFKSNDANGVSQPMWTLNVIQDSSTGDNSVYLYSKYNSPASREPANPLVLPVNRWVHMEAFYDAADGDDGRITIWQDGSKIIDAENVRTLPRGGEGNVVWGIGNYTDHIAGGRVDGTATVYFDDATVSRQRIYANEDCGSGDTPSMLSVEPLTVTEDVGSARVRVVLSPASSEPVRVSFRTNPVEANRGEDFYGLFRILDFAPGQTQAEVEVTILDDDVVENDETFATTIWNPENAGLKQDRSQVSIRDNDVEAAVFSIADQSVVEGDTLALNVRLSRPVGQPTQISLATAPLSAIRGKDYYGTFVVLDFAAGDREKIVELVSLDDAIDESDEQFSVRLFDAVGAGVVDPVARITITDND